MNNNIFFDIAALVVFVTLIFSSIFKRTLKGHTNMLFLLDDAFACVATVCRLVFLCICTYGVPSATNINTAKIFLYLYYIFKAFIMPISVIYIYSSIGILQLYKKNTILRISMELLIMIPCIYILSNIFSGKIFQIDSNLNLNISLYILPVYLCSICVMTIGTISLIVYRKYLNKVKFQTAIFLYPMNIVLTVIQFFFPDIEIAMFAISVTAYLVSTTTQRPELLMDPLVHSGAHHAFFENAKKAFILEKNTTYVFIKITNYRNINLYIGQIHYIEFLNIIADWLNSLCKKYQLNTNSYYLDNCLFALPIEGQIDKRLSFVVTEMENLLKETIKFKGFEINTDSRITIVDCPEDISNYEYLVFFSKNFHNVLPKVNKAILLKDFKNSTDFKMKNDIDKILDESLENDCFEVFYHPIFGINEEKFVSGEALLRLKNDYYGYIPPSVFIPIAEKNGKIHKLGDIVFEKVFKFVASDDFKSLDLDYIEINLSSSQCVEPDLVEKVKGWIEKYQVSPEKIRLEITENAVDMNPAVVEKNINALYDLGIRFALDDYGTGYSNIKKVLSLPIDVVKLDKTFVDEISNEKLNIVIQDTIEMLQSLGKAVLVEGIESKRSVEHFTQIKYKDEHACQYIQGYYFSRPLPEKDFVEFIRKG